MALDSAQKRMSAMNLDSPWRGPLVDATESSFTAGNRAAAVWLYSGLTGSAVVTPVTGIGIELTVPRNSLHFTEPGNPLHFTAPRQPIHFFVKDD